MASILYLPAEVGIYKRKQESKKHAIDQESKIQEKTITIKKKEGKMENANKN